MTDERKHVKTIGFPISHKENERRRTLIPRDLKKTDFNDSLYVESHYGDIIGISDEDYREMGCHVCSREEALSQDVICDPKIGDADYLKDLKEGTTLFGWVHATENRDITDTIIDRKLSAVAWEKMYDSGRHVFWRNNELAGIAAVLHAFECYGMLPCGLKVAVLGRGNTARGAMKVLNWFGADVVQYGRSMEKLFQREIGKYNVLVNCVLWDTSRKDHIIYKSDLKRMKKGAMIIDVSCDRNGAVETTVPTSIVRPTYYVDGICHYAVDHTPSLYYKSFSFMNSKVILPYIKQLVEGRLGKVLKEALIFKNGTILDQEIISYQNR